MKNISRFKKALSAVATLAIMALLVPGGTFDSDNLKASVINKMSSTNLVNFGSLSSDEDTIYIYEMGTMSPYFQSGGMVKISVGGTYYDKPIIAAQGGQHQWEMDVSDISGITTDGDDLNITVNNQFSLDGSTIAPFAGQLISGKQTNIEFREILAPSYKSQSMLSGHMTELIVMSEDGGNNNNNRPVHYVCYDMLNAGQVDTMALMVEGNSISNINTAIIDINDVTDPNNPQKIGEATNLRGTSGNNFLYDLNDTSGNAMTLNPSSLSGLSFVSTIDGETATRNASMSNCANYDATITPASGITQVTNGGDITVIAPITAGSTITFGDINIIKNGTAMTAAEIGSTFTLESDFGPYCSGVGININSTGEISSAFSSSCNSDYGSVILKENGIDEIYFNVQNPLAAPSLNSYASAYSVNLNWPSVTNATGYKVYLDGTLITETGNTYYDLNCLSPDTSYTVEVEAYNNVQTSQKANVSLTTTTDTYYSAPANITFDEITYGASEYGAGWEVMAYYPMGVYTSGASATISGTVDGVVFEDISCYDYGSTLKCETSFSATVTADDIIINTVDFVPQGRSSCSDNSSFVDTVNNNTPVTEPEIRGCMDPSAMNYDPAANTDNASCITVPAGTTALFDRGYGYIYADFNALLPPGVGSSDSVTITDANGAAYTAYTSGDDYKMSISGTFPQGPVSLNTLNYYDASYALNAVDLTGLNIIDRLPANGPSPSNTTNTITSATAVNKNGEFALEVPMCRINNVASAYDDMVAHEVVVEINGVKYTSGSYTEDNGVCQYSAFTVDSYGAGWVTNKGNPIIGGGSSQFSDYAAITAENITVMYAGFVDENNLNADLTYLGTDGGPFSVNINIPGCTDLNAANYDANANTDDGSCQYTEGGNANGQNLNTIYGCTDLNATNYDANANTDDGSCQYTQAGPVDGCMDSTAINYDSNATVQTVCSYSSNSVGYTINSIGELVVTANGNASPVKGFNITAANGSEAYVFNKYNGVTKSGDNYSFELGLGQEIASGFNGYYPVGQITINGGSGSYLNLSSVNFITYDDNPPITAGSDLSTYDAHTLTAADEASIAAITSLNNFTPDQIIAMPDTAFKNAIPVSALATVGAGDVTLAKEIVSKMFESQASVSEMEASNAILAEFTEAALTANKDNLMSLSQGSFDVIAPSAFVALNTAADYNSLKAAKNFKQEQITFFPPSVMAEVINDAPVIDEAMVTAATNAMAGMDIAEITDSAGNNISVTDLAATLNNLATNEFKSIMDIKLKTDTPFGPMFTTFRNQDIANIDQLQPQMTFNPNPALPALDDGSAIGIILEVSCLDASANSPECNKSQDISNVSGVDIVAIHKSKDDLSINNASEFDSALLNLYKFDIQDALAGGPGTVVGDVEYLDSSNEITLTDTLLIGVNNGPGITIDDPNDPTNGDDGQLDFSIIEDQFGELSIVLNSAINTDVVLEFTPSDSAEVQITNGAGTTISTITFTAANWDVPQTVRINAVDDNLVDGNMNYTVTLAVDSGPQDYLALGNTVINVQIIDDDGGNGGGGVGIPEFSDYVLMATLLILGYAMRNRIPELQAIVNKK